MVYRGGNGAVVPSGDAPDVFFSLDHADDPAVFDPARFFCDACNSAHIHGPVDNALKAAVPYNAADAACDPAHILLGAVRRHSAGDGQSVYNAILCHKPEQSLVGVASVQIQAGNGMAVSVEGTAEDRHRRNVCIGQTDISRQIYGLSSGPGIQGAVF